MLTRQEPGPLEEPLDPLPLAVTLDTRGQYGHQVVDLEGLGDLGKDSVVSQAAALVLGEAHPVAVERAMKPTEIGADLLDGSA